MKRATEIIAELSALIAKYGDLPVVGVESSDALGDWVPVDVFEVTPCVVSHPKDASIKVIVFD